jgi:hypothetical protein
LRPQKEGRGEPLGFQAGRLFAFREQRNSSMDVRQNYATRIKKMIEDCGKDSGTEGAYPKGLRILASNMTTCRILAGELHILIHEILNRRA